MFLNINIGQKVCLTPEMQHAIRVLSMGANELNEEIINEVDNNVLIESADFDTNTGIGKNNASVDSNSTILDTVRHQLTLKEHLRKQVSLMNLSSSVGGMILELIEYIDEDGWLSDEVDEVIARIDDEAIRLLQTLDPIGVGGRGLEEVLLIQAKENGNKLMQQLILDELEAVATMDYSGIEKRTKHTLDEIQESIISIKKLNPRPGNSFLFEESVEVPDARVYVDGEVIRLDIINNVFDIKLIDNSKEIVKDNDNLKDSMVRAKCLMNSIRHRNQTLELIMTSIIKKQKEYFLNGDVSMSPMTMSEIAEDCGVHESTVSRISSSKVVQTPFGMLSVKEFFCSSIDTDKGHISSRGVKKLIRSMISEEIVTKPLSDMYITKELNYHGINISRRTVAKYRTAMNIPSSSNRVIKLRNK